ncbi:hypothetical protein KIN20_014017 [Parelaphostrongylus tenuis]|uniref:Uncharacterized protein n=1 Tax=Parelaphostrongylus tenuis TaxID=148309 RepID=A0AAD5QN20_PARTN|nr:hypothetical protein KIN20_014017 [Parelaphostrongylus tenuis]
MVVRGLDKRKVEARNKDDTARNNPGHSHVPKILSNEICHEHAKNENDVVHECFLDLGCDQSYDSSSFFVSQSPQHILDPVWCNSFITNYNINCFNFVPEYVV